jgi:hypothetical protein
MAVSALDLQIARRLADVGLDPADFGEPDQAWRRLHACFGRRATLIDRYALEAARRGVGAEQLDADERVKLTREVLAI